MVPPSRRKMERRRRLLAFFSQFLFLLQFSRCCAGRHSALKILDTLLSQYDRRATPSNRYNNATSVGCELFIRSFGFKDPSSMDYQVDLYLRQSWEDHRLNHENISQALDLNDPRLVRSIWKPEVYFPNAKEADFEKVTVPNVLVRINPKGKILYMLRLKLVFTCMMELSKFPMDTQVCRMELASFSKTIRELTLKWKGKQPVLIYKGLRMPQFKITNIVPTTCQESFQIGSYSCLVVEFHMQRSIGYHLVQSYLPTILFVVISWLSFWMDVDALLPRTSLGITTLLTVSSKSSALQGGVPQVSYVKAIDVWMGTCTAFVFCSLLELTVINCMWRKAKLLSVAQKVPSQVRSSTTTSFITTVSVVGKAPDEPSSSSTEKVTMVNAPADDTKKTNSVVSRVSMTTDGEMKTLARKIDSWCRVLFPSTFVGFVAAYWCYYLL